MRSCRKQLRAEYVAHQVWAKGKLDAYKLAGISRQPFRVIGANADRHSLAVHAVPIALNDPRSAGDDP